MHKLWYAPCSLHSDSNHPTDNSRTQSLTSSVNQFIHPLCQCVPAKFRPSFLLCAPSTIQHPSASTSIRKVSSFIFHADCPEYSASLVPSVNSFFSFQTAALNFERILLMLKDGGSIPRDTLQSQDGINLGDICFCPLLHTLCMQCLSLGSLRTLLSKGAFAPPQSNMPPELSGTTAILLVFQVDSRHKKIINIYMGLVVRQVDSRLYSPSQINDFIQEIEGNLWAAHDALKAGGDPGKRCAYCLFVDYVHPHGPSLLPGVPPTSYIKGIEPNNFDTRNSPMGTRLHHCICRATLQFSNDDPKQRTQYIRSCLILPRGVQYNNWLYPSILELWNHCSPLIDPAMGEPCPMEVVTLGPWIQSSKGVTGTLSCILKLTWPD